MLPTALRQRRTLLAALALAPLALRPVRAASSIEGGTPRQLPLAVVDDLGIEQPALIDDEPATLAVLSLGAFDLPSGRLAGVDALLLEGVPYVLTVAPGRYPLQIVLARLPTGEERVALLQLRLSDRPAARWDNALIEGDDPAALDEDELSVFDVESGVAALFDAAALQDWRAELGGNPDALRQLERVLRENRRPVWTWARVQAAGGSGILVTAGQGEGEVAAYWGRDEAGAPVALVMDFDLLDWAGLPQDPPVTA